MKFPSNLNHDEKKSMKWVPGNKTKSVVLCINALYLFKWCKWDLNRQMCCLNGLITIWSPLSSVCQPWSCQLCAITAVIISISYTLTTSREAPGTLSVSIYEGKDVLPLHFLKTWDRNWPLKLLHHSEIWQQGHNQWAFWTKNCNLWQFCL